MLSPSQCVSAWVVYIPADVTEPPPATFCDPMLDPVPGGEGVGGMLILLLGGRVGVLGSVLIEGGTATVTGTANGISICSCFSVAHAVRQSE